MLMKWDISSMIACRYLCCSLSSVTSEQLFSGAVLIYGNKQKRLLPEKNRHATDFEEKKLACLKLGILDMN